jgi:hypothetical protein
MVKNQTHPPTSSSRLDSINYLNGREPDDEIFEDLIPPKVVRLFNNHPVLKDFIDIDVEFFRCAI